MGIKAQLSEKVKEAMRARDSLALDALRYLSSVINYAEIDLHRDATDEEITSLIQKEVKKRKDGIEQFEKAGRTQTVEEEKKKVNILIQFLPKQLSAEEVKKEVESIISSLPTKDMPSAMREVMAKLKGKADGKMLSDAVKAALSE